MNKVEMVMLMCSAQFALVFLKLLNVRIVVAEHAILASLMSFLIQATWLISTAIGVKAVWDGEIIVVLAYLGAGMLGAYLSFKVKV